MPRKKPPKPGPICTRCGKPGHVFCGISLLTAVDVTKEIQKEVAKGHKVRIIVNPF